MQHDGMIEVSVSYDMKGKPERYDFKWWGGDTTLVTDSLLLEGREEFIKFAKFPSDPGDRFMVGPFRLRTLEYQPWRNAIVAIRERNVITSLCYYWHRCSKLLDIIYHRLIITASVWRLARYDESTIPSWRDLYAAQRLVDVYDVARFIAQDGDRLGLLRVLRDWSPAQRKLWLANKRTQELNARRR